MSKIYIAASFKSADRIYELADELEAEGFIVTGVWFQPHDPIEKMWDNNFGGRIAEAMALRDYNAIDRADIVAMDTLEPSTTGGSHTELGYAQAKGKRVVLVGKATSIFMSLIHETYETWEEFFDANR